MTAGDVHSLNIASLFVNGLAEEVTHIYHWVHFGL
jgi:hypothetical protein